MDPQLLKDLGRILMQSRQSAAIVFHDKSLTLPELLALGSIEHNAMDSGENIYADDLQKILCVSKPAVSQMLKALEAQGYITREINPENRRKLDVILTGSGRDVLGEAIDHYKDTFKRIIEAFGEDKTRQLITLFTEFIETAKDIQQEAVTE